MTELPEHKNRPAGGSPKGLLQRLGRDGHLVEVLRGAGLAVVLRALGAGCAFALNIAIGRLLGAEGAGLYFLALSVTSILAVVSRLGLDHAALRFVSAEAARGDWDKVAGVFRMALQLTCGAGLVLALGVIWTAPMLAEQVMGDPALTEPLRWIALSIVSFSAMLVISESLKGLRRVSDAMLVSGVIYPVVALALIWPLANGFGASGAALAYVLGTGAAALFGLRAWRRAMATHLARPQFDSGALRQSSGPLWIMALINAGFLPWAPLFLLGIWGSTAESGIFGAATRIAMLVSFFLTAVNTVAAPKFAQMHQAGDMAGLARLAKRFALIVTLAASPVFAVMIFGSDWLMGLFGPDFTAGATALAIIALGQLVNTMTGSVGYLLMMTGHERDIRNASIGAAGVMALCAVLLIPGYGILGAAIANAASVVAMNLINSAFVYRRLGFVVIPR